MSTFGLFVVCTPGVEALVVAELARLGIAATPDVGGARATVPIEGLARIHTEARLPAQVLVRVGRCKASSLDALAAGVRSMAWHRFVVPRQPIEVDVALRGAKLPTKGAVDKKVAHAIADALRGPRLIGGRPPREPLRVLVRVEGDRAELSVDASGEPLHRRGWRKATAKAPIRENLAAAVLQAASWSPDEPLVDLMCGSGTFAIEAARVAAGMPVTLRRTFAFERWPCVKQGEVWRGSVGGGGAASIYASDDMDGALKAAESNAARAGVAGQIRFVKGDARQLGPPPGRPGLIVMNPPWGGRIERGGGAQVDALYAQVGANLRSAWAGWRLALVVPRSEDAARIHRGLKSELKLRSGGLPIVIAVGRLPSDP